MIFKRRLLRPFDGAAEKGKKEEGSFTATTTTKMMVEKKLFGKEKETIVADHRSHIHAKRRS